MCFFSSSSVIEINKTLSLIKRQFERYIIIAPLYESRAMTQYVNKEMNEVS